MTEIYINQQEEEILQYSQRINNGLYMEPCISDFISNIELIFPAVSLQNVNQGQNLTSNPDILSAAFDSRSVCCIVPICDSTVKFVCGNIPFLSKIIISCMIIWHHLFVFAGIFYSFLISHSLTLCAILKQHYSVPRSLLAPKAAHLE